MIEYFLVWLLGPVVSVVALFAVAIIGIAAGVRAVFNWIGPL